MTYTMEPCENCNGTGEVEKTVYLGEEGMTIEADVMCVCDECDGTGVTSQSA